MADMQRWTNLCKRQNFNDSAKAAYSRICDRYGEPHRHYHTLVHIQRCLQEVDDVREHLIKPDEVELALWFHDVVYNPAEKDNEGLSAGCADFALDIFGASPALRKRVANLVLATKHEDFPPESDSDARYLVDIDFSIIGAPESLFIETEKQIRKEYSMCSDEEFRQGRIKFLEGALARPKIFCTDHYSKKCEAQARINLQNALKRWQAR